MKRFRMLIAILLLTCLITSCETTLQTFILSLSIVPASAASVSLDPESTTYQAGSTVKLTVNEGKYFTFKYWRGDLSGNDNPAELLMNSNKDVTCVLDSVKYVLVSEWGGSGTQDGQFDSARGIDISSLGDIYVCDRNNGRVQVFDSDGNFKWKWGTPGTGDGEFEDCSAIAIDSNDNVYIGDRFRIQKFDANGNFILKWGSKGSGDGQFEGKGARGIDIDDDGYIYVSDHGNCRIGKFDTDGNFIIQFGGPGTGDGQLGDTIYNVTVSKAGNVFVSDTLNHRIVEFDSDGNFVRQWGQSGSGDGQFSQGDGPALSPGSIAIDSDGYLYVCDNGNYRIQVFDPDGTFIMKWGSQKGSGTGYFEMIDHICVDRAGYVFVTDNNSILKLAMDK